MKRFATPLLPLLTIALCSCDQTAVKKEAYDKGFADGQASVKPVATPVPLPPVGGVPRTQDPQVRRVLPNSKLQGTALDQKIKK